jgi:hypothetical protein
MMQNREALACNADPLAPMGAYGVAPSDPGARSPSALCFSSEQYFAFFNEM